MHRVKLDLNDLTQAHLDECRPHCGWGCTYDAPCIIGTLIPKDVREDPAMPQHSGINGGRIQKFVRTIPEQMPDLVALQDAFDSGDWDRLVAVASKYVKELVA